MYKCYANIICQYLQIWIKFSAPLNIYTRTLTV